MFEFPQLPNCDKLIREAERLLPVIGEAMQRRARAEEKQADALARIARALEG